MVQSELVTWVNDNLDIVHSGMSKSDARKWLRLMMADWNAFVATAMFGFAKKKLRDCGSTTVPGTESRQFVQEFIVKLRLAYRGHLNGMKFPLFAVCGKIVFDHMNISMPDVQWPTE